MRIVKFKNFINESRGFATSVIPYVNFINNLSFLTLDEFLNERQNIFRRKTYTKEDFKIPEPKWRKLPISSMDLKIEVKNIIDKDIKNPFLTTGFCFNMDQKDGSYLKNDDSIHIRIEIEIEINDTYSHKDLNDLKTDIESTTMHELNHVYEGYKRKINGYPPLQDAITKATDYNTENVPKEIWDYWWEELGYPIYYSESQEMNAMVHDSIPWTSKYPIEEMKKKNITWDKAISMIEFNAEEFKEDIIKLIKSNTNEDPISLMTRMKDGLANKIEQISDEKGEKNPSLDPEKIKKMSIDKFLNYLEKRINTRGEILKRKILRTYSL